MKKMNVTCTCMCSYSSFIMVPDEMSLDEAVQYAKNHTDEIDLGELEYIQDSD